MKFRRFFAIFLAVGLSFTLFAAEQYTVVRRVFISRHGQKGSSKGGKLRIKGDVHISELGVVQAIKMGGRLKEKGFNGKIYASPYLRCVETAAYAGKVLGLKVYPDARVQECVHDNRKGRIDIPNTPNIPQGRTLEQLRAEVPWGIADDAKLEYPWLYTEPERYTIEHKEREMKALDAILAENPNVRDFLIVGHGGGFTAFHQGFAERIGKKLTKQLGWNCALVIYELDSEGKWHYVGSEIDFLKPEEVTSNKKYMIKIDAKKNKSNKK